MSRLQELFRRKDREVLNVYCTAGYPGLDDTMKVMKALEDNGADLIELGIPYSDPLADGEVIQESSAVSLANGMTIATLFTQLENMRKEINVPVILMGYLNPLLQFGFEKFCAEAKKAGVDGLIIPDMPPFEFENEYGATLKKYELDFVFLVTPETSDNRVRHLDSLSSGFLYAVSSSSVTGSNQDFGGVQEYLERLQKLQLKNPVLVGFGIRDRETFQMASKFANGAIIGSAYIRAIKDGQVGQATKKFLSEVLDR